MKDACKSGKWEEDEERRLVEAVHDVTGTPRGTSVTSNVPWSRVAAAVDTRSEKQCRTKWLNYSNWKQVCACVCGCVWKQCRTKWLNYSNRKQVCLCGSSVKQNASIIPTGSR